MSEILEPIKIRKTPEVDDFQYDEFLDECYGDFYIGNIGFSASRILSELDPIAYRCGISDYEDTLEEEIFWECPICGEEYDEYGEAEAKWCCQIEIEEDEEEDI